MYIIVNQKIECSKCGSSNYESFTRSNGESGTRCLACKHEYIKAKTYPWILGYEMPSYTHKTDEVIKF